MTLAFYIGGTDMNTIEIGARIGSLTITDIYTDNGRRVRAECACGMVTRPRHQDVRTGAVQSCGGCQPRRTSIQITQGQSRTKLYQVWSNMRDRCARRLDYRDKGITVWEYWQNDFEAFRSWALDNGFEEELTLDRRDNAMGYRPSNCRFVTHAIQKQNRDVVTLDLATVERNRIAFYYGGDTKRELADRTGQTFDQVRASLSRKAWRNAIQLFRPIDYLTFPRLRPAAAADALLASIVAHYA